MSAQTLTEFLLARISDDEAMAERRFNEWRDGGGVLDLALTPGPGTGLLAAARARRKAPLHCDWRGAFCLFRCCP